MLLVQAILAAQSLAVDIHAHPSRFHRANVESIVSGRLSTQKYPTSSNALVAELMPDPLRPVMTTNLSAAFSVALFFGGIRFSIRIP